MNSHGLTKENFMETLPPALRKDASVVALAEATAEVLARRLAEIDRVRIFSNIDHLDEPLLDVLAYDLKVDWYDYNYPIEAKRAVIKSSILVHKRLGTVYAVKSALGSVYPNSEVEEWFNYGGEPFHFQIVLNTAQSRAPAEFFSIKRTVDYYKRFSAHMDGVIFQCSIGIVIQTESHGYRYRTTWAGRHYNGTVPWRDMRGGLGDARLDMGISAAGYAYEAPANGTQPWRNTPGGVGHSRLDVRSGAHGWPYISELSGQVESGTTPWRKTGGGAAHEELEVDAAAAGAAFHSPAAGTRPYRTTFPGLEDGKIEVEARARGFPYVSVGPGEIEAGMAPYRATGAAMDDDSLEVGADAQGFLYAVPSTGRQESGTFPDRETGGEALAGAFFTQAEAEGFHYKVTMCGTSYCKS